MGLVMAFKDFLPFFIFWLVIIAIILVCMHFDNQKQTVAIDFIELPSSVIINPDLK